MKKISIFIFSFFLIYGAFSQVLAPDFTIVDTDGQTHNLYDYCEDGKTVVLDFFYVGCSYCEYYSVHIQQSYENFGCNNGDVIFLGIDWNDTDAEVQTFDSTYGLTYPSASGLEGGGDSVVSLYNISYYTTLLVIGSNKHILKNIKPPTTTNIDSFLTIIGAQKMPCNVSIDEEKQSEQISLIQNPISSSEKIRINVNAKGNYMLRISNLNGSIIQTSKEFLMPGENQIDMNTTLSRGIYFLHIENGKQSLNFKLVVQ